jgi:hypothetical protein
VTAQLRIGILLVLAAVQAASAQETPTPDVAVAGARSSKYGIRPFPTPEQWVRTLTQISGRFPGSRPTGIWIVGALHEREGCGLEFPSPGQSDPSITFDDVDKHEPYLAAFDAAGIQVFLQVEPGLADPERLIDLVLSRYAHHPSVVGFGIDVEWYRESEHPEWGEKVDDETARRWEARVQSHQADYRLFLKHWDRGWMPPTYRGRIVFVDDSQQLAALPAMVDEFALWGSTFAPNPVFFQVGYPADAHWWQTLPDPISDIGQAVCARIAQPCGLIWVDFTLRGSGLDF